MSFRASIYGQAVLCYRLRPPQGLSGVVQDGFLWLIRLLLYFVMISKRIKGPAPLAHAVSQYRGFQRI